MVLGGVHELAFEILQAWNLGPFEIVQHSTSIDEEFCLVVDNGVGLEIPNLEPPLAGILVPLSMLDLVLEFNVFVDEAVLVEDAFEVIPYFGRIAVVVRP